MLSRVLTPRSVLLKCHQPGLTNPSELELSARKALEAYRSGPEHKPAVADVLEQFIGDPACRELDFRGCAVDCLQIPDALVRALMALRFETPPRSGEGCKLLFPAGLKAYPTWMVHAPGWLASVNLRHANPPFDASEANDGLFGFDSRTVWTTPNGRDLIRQLYEVKDGADLRLPKIDGQPLCVPQFMDSLESFLPDLRSGAEACKRVAFECGAASDHSTPVIYIREDRLELIVCIDSLGGEKIQLDAISRASHRLKIRALVVQRQGMASFGCRVQSIEAGRRLVAIDDSGLPVIPVDDLMADALRLSVEGEVFSILLPDSLLFYAEISSFREVNRQPQGAVMRRRGNGESQSLDEFVNANITGSNGRMEYLLRKEWRHPIFIAVVAHLNRLVAESLHDWPLVMKQRFIADAQCQLRASEENLHKGQIGDRMSVESALAKLDRWLADSGVASLWSSKTFSEIGKSGKSLLEHVLISKDYPRKRRVISQAMRLFDSLTLKDRGLLLAMAISCEDHAALRELLTVLAPDAERVKPYLMAYGVPLNERQPDKMTLLGRAAKHGHLDAVRHWLDLGCEVDRKAAQGRTPLMQAVVKGHLPVVKELLTRGAQPDINDKAGDTALVFAADQGSLEIVRALIDAGASPDHPGANGDTPLMIAAAAGQTDVVNVLLSSKANVLARDSGKRTALMHAATAGNLGMVKLLADPATVNDLDASGMSALSCAVAADDIDMCSLLVQAGAQPSPADGVPALTTAVAAKKREAMRWLLKLPGVDVNARRSGAGDTALTVAARLGDADSVDLLLERPAIDVNATGHHGRTALWEAVSGGHEDLVEKLLAAGADAGIADLQGLTPQALASRRGNASIVDALHRASRH